MAQLFASAASQAGPAHRFMLGEALAALPEDRLAAIDMPEVLRDALSMPSTAEAAIAFAKRRIEKKAPVAAS